MRISRKRKRLAAASPELANLIIAEQSGFRTIRELRGQLRDRNRFHTYHRGLIMRYLIEIRQLLDVYPQLEPILHSRWYPVEQKARKFISDNLKLFEQEQFKSESKVFPLFYDFASMMYRSSLEEPMAAPLQRAYFQYKLSRYHEYAVNRLESR